MWSGRNFPVYQKDLGLKIQNRIPEIEGIKFLRSNDKCVPDYATVYLRR
jgi:hypothetical protein